MMHAFFMLAFAASVVVSPLVGGVLYALDAVR